MEITRVWDLFGMTLLLLNKGEVDNKKTHTAKLSFCFSCKLALIAVSSYVML